MPTLTIFTPTYNRAHTICRTYESLCRQTCHDFEWLVVDDGSTDNTHELVEGWMAAGEIPIRYIYQQNQGMHGAHNTAYKNISTELNVCIDSDDWMPNDAVEKIVHFWQQKGMNRYAGLMGLDVREDGSVIGASLPAKTEETTLTSYYAKGGSGDKKLVYRTDVVKQYPEYPLFEGERYVGLAYKYMLIDQDYKLLTFNEPLCVVEYQELGSSFSMYRQYWSNPNGFAFFRKTEMITALTWKRRFVSNVHYVSSCIIARNRHWLKESPMPGLTLVAAPLGIVLYMYIKYKVRTGAKMEINK